MELRDYLVDKLKKQIVSRKPDEHYIVSLDDYFVGNSEAGSIGANLNADIGPQYFYEILKNIEKNEAVEAIYVGISGHDFNEPEYWPFADQIIIYTSVPREKVAEWLSPLQPDELLDGWVPRKPVIAPTPKVGFAVYTAWWD